MTNPWLQYAMPGINGLKPYEPGKPIPELERELGITNIIKLASNENPLGPSPKGLDAVRSVLVESALYPDGNAFELKRKLAAHHDVDIKQLITGSGSDHILELIARVFLGPGRSAVISQYAFAVYFIVAQAASAEVRIAKAHPTDHAMPYGHDLNAMLDEVDDTTRVVFIANPNNPTGTWLARDELTSFLNEVPESTTVVVDEAYFDFVTESQYPDTSKLLAQFPNVITLRTFSKAYGLAGLRVGYALCSRELTDLLNRARLSFNPNSLAQAAAVAALDDTGHLKKTVSLNSAERKKLDRGLNELGLRTIPSVCNFVTVDVERPGREVFQQLLQRGVIVRPLDGYGLPTHLRISVGLPEENERLLKTLGEVLDARSLEA